MATLADYIEKYLQDLLQQAERNYIELQRRVLAQQFKCVPSQINYVLTTRFTLDRGYLVESRRGEGGYIRIQRISLPKSLLQEMAYKIDKTLTQKQAEDLLYALLKEKLLAERDYRMTRLMLQEGVVGLTKEMQDLVRANLLKAILIALS